jgi:preprotein translocase subunit SecA
MKTGEGKTIVALLPAYLNALYSKGVHVVTTNDYLARRDAQNVGQVHKFLGLSVGLIQEKMKSEERQQNYNCDVVYLTNNELGFDYLRDNMAFTIDDVVQRPFFYCLVDEVDSILIDEARTPLIISGINEAPTQKYYESTKLAGAMQKNIHYSVDEKNQNVILLESGVKFCERALRIINLYNPDNPWISYILNSIKAKELFKLNTNYIINVENDIVIVDEFTGRTMEGRRWSDGLHQAVEAKENVKIQDESQTLASITYQNLFLLYKKLSGMTGTAKTEEIEFEKIYNLKVVEVPTNQSIRRKDFPDLIYKNQYLKWQAIAKECVDMNKLNRPILIGTTTIEKSELLAALLSEYKLSYRLLNARPENITSESEIVAQAGNEGSITISTNMAGRGTDITLGGNAESLLNSKLINVLKTISNEDFSFENDHLLQDTDLAPFNNFFKNLDLEWLRKESNMELFFQVLNKESFSDNSVIKSFTSLYNSVLKDKKELEIATKSNILKLGGLHVIGTERHESRRIDNQLRGRSGRQGDVGSSRFFLSLDDKLLRLFGGDKILDMMQNVGLEDETPIQSPLLNRSLESAQKKVEAYYFDSRKQLFEYDQALNMQRNGLYSERSRIIQLANMRNWILEYGDRSFYDIVNFSLNEKGIVNSLVEKKAQELLGLYYPISLDFGTKEEISETSALQQQFKISYDLKELQLEALEPGLMRQLEKSFLLEQIDFAWKEHLQKISSLRDSLRWRSYGQRNPLTDYKRESYNLFIRMSMKLRHRVIYFILRSKILLTN